jgi:hypothetical protein
MASAAASGRFKIPHALFMEFCWRIRCILEKSRPLASNMTRKEFIALKYLK